MLRWAARPDVQVPLAAVGASLLLGALVNGKPTLIALCTVGLLLVLPVLLFPIGSSSSAARILLLVLLALTSAFGREFSYLNPGSLLGDRLGFLYVTEFTLLVIVVLLCVRLTSGRAEPDAGLPADVKALIAAYGLIGLVAATRGLTEGYGLYFVSRDSVLVVYAAFTVVTIMLIPRLADVRQVHRVLSWAALAATAYALLSAVGGVELGAVPVAIGVYMSFFFLPVFARASDGRPVAVWEWVVVAIQITVLFLFTVRTSWVALVAAVAVLAVTGTVVQRQRIAEGLTFMTVIIATVLLLAPTAFSTRDVASDVVEAATAIVQPGLDNYRAANAAWRLDFWTHELRKVGDNPLAGVGFGPGANFCFVNGVCEDARRSKDPTEITGPHNSFVNIAFRMGLPGLLAVLALMYVGVRGAWRSLKAARSAGRDGDAVTIRVALATFMYVAVTSFFAVALEGPFIGIFFWVTLGLLFVCRRPSEATGVG